jgi:hypothetical protein
MSCPGSVWGPDGLVREWLQLVVRSLRCGRVMASLRGDGLTARFLWQSLGPAVFDWLTRRGWRMVDGLDPLVEPRVLLGKRVTTGGCEKAAA